MLAREISVLCIDDLAKHTLNWVAYGCSTNYLIVHMPIPARQSIQHSLLDVVKKKKKKMMAMR